MSDRVDELLDERHQQVLSAVKGVHDRLDLINGRTRTLEKLTAVLTVAYLAGAGVLTFLANKFFGGHP